MNRKLFAEVAPALIPMDDITLTSPDGTTQTILGNKVELVHSISNVYPDVTVDESHLDQLTITDHPVEKGAGNAYIQDNAFKLPAEVTITYGWAPGAGPPTEPRSETFLNEIYQQLLAIQSSRALFQVKTTRRVYDNMILQGVTLTTDMYTQNALLVRMTCREIIFAESKAVVVSTSPGVQMFPEKTQEVQPRGVQQLQSAPTFNYTLFPGSQ